MQKRQKIITTVLDILLLFGALFSVLTINGGQWARRAANYHPDVLPRYEALTGPDIDPYANEASTAGGGGPGPAVCPSGSGLSVASYDLWRECARFAR